jgi:hypothetical protein
MVLGDMVDVPASPPCYGVVSTYSSAAGIIKKRGTHPKHRMQHTRRGKRKNEIRIRQCQVLEPQDASRLQPRNRQLRHSTQQHKRSVAGEHLHHRQHRLPHLNSGTLMNNRDLLSHRHHGRLVVVTLEIHHLRMKRLRLRRCARHARSVVGGIDV